MTYRTAPRSIRVELRWLDSIDRTGLSFEARWHYLCLVKHCTERRLYDGVLSEPVLHRAIDASELDLIMAELADVGLIAEHPNGYRMLRLDEHWPTSWSNGSAGPTLYRLYDADLRLLYIGITDNIKRRIREHAELQPWWPQVHGLQLERFEDYGGMVRAERIAIERESSQHNVVHRRLPRRQCGHTQSSPTLADGLCRSCRFG